jgi:hypothetical protein
MVALRNDVDHPDAAVAREAALRSLDRPQAPGLRASLLAGTRDADVRTRAGLYVGRARTYDVDVERLDRVVCRITRGLFYKTIRRPLPANPDVRSYLLSQFEPSAGEAIARLQDIITTVRRGPPRIIGRRVLMFWSMLTSDEPDGLAWYFVFYERVAWVAMTLPRLGSDATESDP